MPRWTADEDTLLLINPGADPAHLAAMLHRTPDAVAMRISRLRARHGEKALPKRKRNWTPEEDALLLSAGMAGAELEEAFAGTGRTLKAAQLRRWRLLQAQKTPDCGRHGPQSGARSVGALSHERTLQAQKARTEPGVHKRT